MSVQNTVCTKRESMNDVGQESSGLFRVRPRAAVVYRHMVTASVHFQCLDTWNLLRKSNNKVITHEAAGTISPLGSVLCWMKPSKILQMCWGKHSPQSQLNIDPIT